MRDPLTRIALILGLLSAIGPFAIDMYLPALPQVARDLETTEKGAAMTLGAYFIAFGIGQMIWGPLADACGRKGPLAWGVVLFLLASIAAWAAPSIHALVAARAVQGLGAATLMAVPRAILRDIATGPRAQRLMATIMVVTAVSPMLAPLTGSAVLTRGGWREIFAILAGTSLVSLALIALALPETLAPPDRRPIRVAGMARDARHLLGDRRFVGLTLVGGFGMASFFVYLAAASFVFTGQYGLGPTGFSLAFAANAVGFFSASQFAAGLARRWGTERVIAAAVTAFLAVTAGLASLVLAGFDALWLLLAGLVLANAAMGIVAPTTMVLSLDPHPRMAGLASSLGGTIQMLTGAGMIALAAPFMDNTARSMTPAIAACALLAWVSAVVALPRPGWLARGAAAEGRAGTR